jgi:hypothetical protein
MSITLTLTSAATRLSMWSAQHAAATRMMMTVLPMTLAIAAAVVLHSPHSVSHIFLSKYHIAPACGSGSGGC